MSFWKKNFVALQNNQPECLRWILDGMVRLRKQEPVTLLEVGNSHTAVLDTGNQKIHLYSKYRPQQTKATLNVFQGHGWKTIWLGLGLGYELLNWLAENNFKEKIFIMEKEPACVAAFLQIHDVTELIQQGQIIFLTDDVSLINEAGVILENRRITKYWPEFYGKIILQMTGHLPGKKRAVILRHVTFAQDLAMAARKIGWDIMELDWQEEGSMAMTIAGFKPLFVLTINISEKVRQICKLLGLNYVSWTVDIPAYNFFQPENRNPLYRHYTADCVAYQQARSLGWNNVYYLPPATSGKVKTQQDLETWRHLKNYVVFIGNTSFVSEFQNLIGLVSAKCSQQLNEMIIRQVESPDYWCLPQIINEFISTYPALWHEVVNRWGLQPTDGYTVKDKLAYYLGKESAGRIRLNLVEEIMKKCKVAVFGDEGWQKLAHNPNFLYGGTANHYTEVPAIYQSAGVNLNLTRPYAQNRVLPVRIFDVLGSGGFLLSNEDSLLKEYFRPDEHLILCSSKDIAEQAANWLNKPARIRQEIAEAGQKLVTDQHLFEHRWRMFINEG